MKTRVISTAVSICFAAAVPAFADDAEYLKIREGMKKLAPLVGQWRAAVTFHDEDGLTAEEGLTRSPPCSTTPISSWR